MASVTYRIGGKYDNSAMNQAKRGLQDFQKAVNAFKATAVVTALTAITKKALDCESAFLEADKSIKRLDFAASLNPNLQKTSRQLQNFAQDVSAKLRGAVSVDELNAEIAKLSFDKTGAEIEKIIPVATDLSAALGISLSEAVTQLNNTFAGTTGTLGKMFPELKNLSKEALASGEAIDLIGDKVKGMGEEMAKSGTGSVQAFKNEMNNLKEAIGGVTTNFFTPLRNELTKLAAAWAENINSARDFKNAVKDLNSGNATADTYRALLAEAQKRKAKIKAEPDSITKAGDLEKVNREIKKYTNLITELETKTKEQTKATTTVVQAKQEEVKAVKEVVKAYKVDFNAMGRAALQYQKERNEANDEVIEMQIRARKYRLAEIEAIKAETKARWASIGNTFAGGTGEIGSLVSSGVSGGFVGILVNLMAKALSALESMSDNVKWLNSSISELFKSVFTPGSSFMNAIDYFVGQFRDGFESLKGIVGAIFDAVGEIVDMIGDSFKNFTAVLNSVAPAVIAIVKTVGTILGIVNTIVDIFEPFSNLITLFVKGIASIVVVIVDIIGNLLTAIYNAIISVYNFFASSKKQKDKKSYNSVTSDLNSIWNTPSASGAASANASNTYSSGTASYTAARDVYVTVNYVSSYVNGDARAIALNIRDEIKAAERLGY